MSKTRSKLLDEAYLLVRLDCVHIVKHIGILETGQAYVMENWGESLKNMVYRIADVKNIFLAIASGLSFIHEQGYVHLDLKLANILIDKGRVKIGRCGTPGYMAPEVETKTCKDGKAADIYSMGEVFSRMFDGEGELANLIEDCKKTNPLERPEISEVLERLDKMIIRRDDEKVVETQYEESSTGSSL